ncbi:MAG: hypothetical protein IPL12_02080 [Bacteroidetes bacterium]|nr:hypothetical protein [Bacteroidota bacterium]
MVNSDKGKYKEEASKIFEDIISEKGLVNSKIKYDQLNELKSIAHFNIAQLLITDGEIANAKSNSLAFF